MTVTSGAATSAHNRSRGSAVPEPRGASRARRGTPLSEGWTEPGRCSVHGEILVTPARAGIVWRAADRGATYCPARGHWSDYQADLCMYCGPALFAPSPVSRVHAGGPQRRVCDVRCRVGLLRWRRAHPGRVRR